jgi:hypothetical protein
MNPRTALLTQNLKTSTVMLRELLNESEQSRVAQQLSAKQGVRTAHFSTNEPRCVKVEYDADRVSVLGILTFFEGCALHARAVQMLQGRN